MMTGWSQPVYLWRMWTSVVLHASNFTEHWSATVALEGVGSWTSDYDILYAIESAREF